LLHLALLKRTHAGLIPTRRVGFDREEIEAFPPVTLWTTTTNFRIAPIPNASDLPWRELKIFGKRE
jgi:hypothetical protein